MTIEKKIVQTEIFTAPDGSNFLSQKEAESYVNNVLARKKNVRYFVVHHSPDCTEGRGMYGQMLVAIEMNWSHDLMIEVFCEQHFGSRVAWVMGCSPTTNWSISKASEEDFMDWENRSARVGDYRHKATRLFISNEAKPLEGYPVGLKMPTRDREKFENIKDYIEGKS